MSSPDAARRRCIQGRILSGSNFTRGQRFYTVNTRRPSYYCYAPLRKSLAHLHYNFVPLGRILTANSLRVGAILPVNICLERLITVETRHRQMSHYCAPDGVRCGDTKPLHRRAALMSRHRHH